MPNIGTNHAITYTNRDFTQRPDTCLTRKLGSWYLPFFVISYHAFGFVQIHGGAKV